MKKLAATVLCVLTVFSSATVISYAQDDTISVSIFTDKSKYSLSENAKVEILVINNSRWTVKNIIVNTITDNWLLLKDKSDGKNVFNIDSLTPGESKTFSFECALSSKAENLSLIQRIFLFFLNLFKNSKQFSFLSLRNRSFVTDEIDVTHGDVNVNLKAVCYFGNGNIQNGDTLSYGSYPQSLVTDADLINSLNQLDGTAVSIDSTLTAVDISHNNEKYRKITIKSSRKNAKNSSSSIQKTNGFYTGKTYYFKYEPLEWQALDIEQGLFICKSVIDCQCFSANMVVVDYNNKNPDGTNASCWSGCSLRQFVNQAFIDKLTLFQKNYIENTTFSTYSLGVYSGNDKYSSNNSADVTDKFAVPSYSDLFINTVSDKVSLACHATDYAKAMGVTVDDSSDTSPYFLRNASDNSTYCCSVSSSGELSRLQAYMLGGVRPIMVTNTFSSLSQFTAQYTVISDKFDNKEIPLTISKKSGDYSVDFLVPFGDKDVIAKVLQINGQALAIVPSLRAYVVLRDSNIESFMPIGLAEPEGDFIGTGNTEIQGEAYTTEEYFFNDGTIKYCFDSDNILKYAKFESDSENTFVRFDSFSKTANASFSIPSNCYDCTASVPYSILTMFTEG